MRGFTLLSVVIVILIGAVLIGGGAYILTKKYRIQEANSKQSSERISADTNATVQDDGISYVSITDVYTQGNDIFIKVKPLGEVSYRPTACEAPDDKPYGEDLVFGLKSMFFCDKGEYSLRTDIPVFAIKINPQTIIYQFASGEVEKAYKTYEAPKFDSKSMNVNEFAKKLRSQFEIYPNPTEPYRLEFKDKLLISIQPIWRP